ncbi:MFS transporter [Clostridium lundense]|uniref:MFS transporter n=1 Tax=Clostridium lundense TaxID=319475 RepID=UPI0006845F08|nr:MFS transporter [Clostridium lundense]
MKTKIFNRNFILLIIGQASSMFGTVLLKFTVSLLILDLTGSAALFGTITAISYLPPVFLSPVGGILADRKNKRNLMVVLDGMYCVMAILLAVSLSLPNELIYITIIMVVLSVISSFETPVVQSSVPLIQQKDSFVKSNAIVSQVNMIANLAGPLLAGLFYGITGKDNLSGVQMILFSCAVCFFLAAILETFIKIPKVSTQQAGNSLQMAKKDLFEGIRFLTTEQTYVFKAILLNAAFVFMIQPLITTGAPFIIRIVLELNSVLNGLSQAFMGAAGLMGGVIAELIADKFKASKIYQLFLIMGVAIVVFGIAVILNLSTNMTYIIFVIIGIVIFICASIAGIFIMSAIQQNVPNGMLGRVMSFYSVVVNATLPIGIFLYGYLYEEFINDLSMIMFATAFLIFVVGYIGKKTYQHL